MCEEARAGRVMMDTWVRPSTARTAVIEAAGANDGMMRLFSC